MREKHCLPISRFRRPSRKASWYSLFPSISALTAKPLVAKGDTVLAGQKIAEAGGFISANVICSVSGTVKGIEPRLMANGSMVQSIIVENDGEYRTVEGFGQKRD